MCRKGSARPHFLVPQATLPQGRDAGGSLPTPCLERGVECLFRHQPLAPRLGRPVLSHPGPQVQRADQPLRRVPAAPWRGLQALRVHPQGRERKLPNVLRKGNGVVEEAVGICLQRRDRRFAKGMGLQKRPSGCACKGGTGALPLVHRSGSQKGLSRERSRRREPMVLQEGPL